MREKLFRKKFPSRSSQKNLTEKESGLAETATLKVEIIDAVLPEQELIVTQWFHSDCISSYYKLKPLSAKHWQWLDKFIATAADNGINLSAKGGIDGCLLRIS